MLIWIFLKVVIVMCKCYVLYGRANVGKTTSLELVIEKLLANGAKEIKWANL